MRHKLLLGHNVARVWLLAMALLVTAAATARVRAEDCAALPNPVFVAGSTAVKLLVSSIAAQLRQQAQPITLVFASSPTGSCAGVGLIMSDTKLTGTGIIYDNAGKEIPSGCTLNNNSVDLALSDVWPSTCEGMPVLPATLQDFLGPVQIMTFIVPSLSSQNSISAQAAYLVFGFGESSGVAPWSEVASIFVRKPDSGTQQMISKAIRVPAAKFQGTANSSGGDVLKGVTSAANADKAIGILAADAIARDNTNVKVLAYQHYGQIHAYWPDSTPGVYDKLNVRDGHYPIWGPLHMLAKTAAGAIVKPEVKTIVDYLSGAIPPDDKLDLIDLEATHNVVPQCAMHVARTEDGGALSCVMPAKDCTCKYLKSALGAAPAECQACVQSPECPAARPVCNYGFCEAS